MSLYTHVQYGGNQTSEKRDDFIQSLLFTHRASSFFCSRSASCCTFFIWLSFSLLILFSSGAALFWAMLSSPLLSSWERETNSVTSATAYLAAPPAASSTHQGAGLILVSSSLSLVETVPVLLTSKCTFSLLR